MNCKYCGGSTKRHELVPRMVKRSGGKKYYISVERRKCLECGRTFRTESDIVAPYKHYEREIISGVLEGTIDSDTLGFENYPSELTMSRWRSQNIHGV